MQQRTDAAGAVPEREAKSKPQSREFSKKKIEIPQSQHRIRNVAIRNQTHDAGKDLRRARYSQSGCCQDYQRNSQRSRRQWRCKRKPSTSNVRRALCRVKETSRAKSAWHEEQQGCDSVEQHSSVQDRGAHAQPKQKRTRDQQAKNRENQRGEELQQIRS